MFYPISKPEITATDLKHVSAAVESGWVSSIGCYINRFEEEFADYCGVEYALTVANGTVALHLALETLGIGQNDEVIVPDLTFVATANAVKYVGAKPVLVDVEKSNFCISVAAVKDAITSKTKAIIPVHLYGHPAPMIELKELCQKYNLYLIEDAAEALGASIGCARVGGLGNVATHSFYGNKIITTGEGGMLTTNSKEIYERAKLLRDHAMDPVKRYWHTEVGFNYRMTNMQAALGYSQLQRIDFILEKRMQILSWYSDILSQCETLTLNPCCLGFNPVNWLTCVNLEDGITRYKDEILNELSNMGIDTRPYFHRLSDLPMFDTKHKTENSKKISISGFNLPTYTELGKDDVYTISRNLLNLIEKK